MNIGIAGRVLVVGAALVGCCGPKCREAGSPVLPYEIIRLYPVTGGAPEGMCLGVFYVPRWLEDFTRGVRVESDPTAPIAGTQLPREEKLERDLPMAMGCDWHGNYQGQAYDPRRSVIYVVGDTSSVRRSLAGMAGWVDMMTNSVVSLRPLRLRVQPSAECEGAMTNCVVAPSQPKLTP
jgi:hypothetical protein